MATAYPIRPFTENELEALLTLHEHAFHFGPTPAAARKELQSRMEFDRSLAAFDGSLMVGAAGTYSFQMRVPGALVPVAGVSIVAVLPTHRRRGVLSGLMRRQLADVRDRGEAVAALFASEAGIYRRYGYGRASWHAFYRLRRGEGALVADAPADEGLRLRLASPADARAEMAKVHEQMLAVRPGFYARSDAWWDHLLDDPESERGGATPLRCLLAEDDAGPRGYAVFSTKGRWEEATFLPDAAVYVRESFATDPAANAAIWADLLSRDLASEWEIGRRPVDDPLLHLLADPRRVRPQVADGLWIRLVDVGNALAQRRYASPAEVVIEVADPDIAENRSRWRLAISPAPPGEAGDPGNASAVMAAGGYTATCERTTAPADLVAPVHALGSAYLGGTRLGALASAGLVTEVTPGAVAALSAAMSWDPAPWCPMIF
jgi:predicted acetyltransferase